MQKVKFSSLLLKSVDEFYRTNQGLYPKNIRQYSSFLFFFFLSEWACFLCSPLSDPYFDSLALTRTLGDFHLQTYGLTYSFTLSSDAPRYVPSISCIDLRESITVKYDYSLMNHKTDLLNDIDNCRNKKENLNKPTMFEYEFTVKETCYAYGFSVNLKEEKIAMKKYFALFQLVCLYFFR